MTTDQSRLLGMLAGAASRDDRKEAIIGLCRLSSAEWSWSLIGIWLWQGLGADGFPDIPTRFYMVETIAARIEFWRDTDRRLGFSYDVINANQKPGIDLLIRVANFDPEPDVRMGAVEALEKLGEVGALICLFPMTPLDGVTEQALLIMDVAAGLLRVRLN